MAQLKFLPEPTSSYAFLLPYLLNTLLVINYLLIAITIVLTFFSGLLLIAIQLQSKLLLKKIIQENKRGILPLSSSSALRFKEQKQK